MSLDFAVQGRRCGTWK